MTGVLQTAGSLASLARQRAQTRLRRCCVRLLSPKRWLATLAATLFLLLYVANGVLIVLTRKAADPADLTHWLGGAMAVYGLFHFVRAAWQEPDRRLGLSLAESQWIGRAPIADSYLVLYRLMGVIAPSLIKAALIAVVMWRDVVSLGRLVIALFLALVVLESLRLVADRMMGSLSAGGRRVMRTAMSGVAIAIIVQLAARMVAAAAGSSHPLALLSAFSQSLGDTAGSTAIQYLAFPWQPMAQLALTHTWGATTWGLLALSLLVVAGSIAAVIAVDRWAAAHQSMVERKQLSRLQKSARCTPPDAAQTLQPRKLLRKLPRVGGIGPLVSRQWVGVVRYRGTILMSLALPGALSLSPLITSADAGLMHVGAWLAVSTLLLAPPALRLDFRRDIDRMWLLKSLPVSALTMTLGQLILPSLITMVFQLIVVALAYYLVPTAAATLVLVIGCLSGFALFSFALENTLFLTFPHRIKQEGLAMMVRAKLVFLGKGLLLALLGGAFLALITLGTDLHYSVATLVVVCIAVSWITAVGMVLLTARCWRRFDIRLDSPLAA